MLLRHVPKIRRERDRKIRPELVRKTRPELVPKIRPAHARKIRPEHARKIRLAHVRKIRPAHVRKTRLERSEGGGRLRLRLGKSIAPRSGGRGATRMQIAGSGAPMIGRDQGVRWVHIGLLMLLILSFPTVPVHAHELLPASSLKTNQFDYEYVEPKNPAHRPLYDALRMIQILEKFQEFLSPLRFPIKVTLKLRGCDGVINATFWDDAIQICYEYLEWVMQQAPKAEKMGLTPRDALIGPAVDVFLHEAGHAVLEVLEIPFFGREEDSADYFASYALLQFAKDDARRLILGASFLSGKEALEEQEKAPEMRLMADTHGLPAQRFFSRLCMAYGFDQELFGDVVTLGYLPQSRAKNCRYEYKTNEYAFKSLVAPYIDQELMQKVRSKQWFQFESSAAGGLEIKK